MPASLTMAQHELCGIRTGLIPCLDIHVSMSSIHEYNHTW